MVIPAGIIHDWIKTDAEDLSAHSLRLAHFSTDVGEPASRRWFFRTGFAQEQWPTISIPGLEEHLVKRAMEKVPGRRALILVNPLVVPVVVDANNVETVDGWIFCEPVPYVILRGRVALGVGAVLGLGRVRDDVDEGFRLQEAGVWRDGTDRVDGGERGAYKLALERVAFPLFIRVERADIASDPGPEGDFVDRAEEGDSGCVFGDERCGCVGKGGEALDELWGEEVEVRRDAPVAEVPDDLRAGGGAGVEHGEKARPVVEAGLPLDEVPAKPVAHGEDARLLKQAVVGFCAEIVVRAVNDIHLQPVGPTMGGAFKTACEEACEWILLTLQKEVLV